MCRLVAYAGPPIPLERLIVDPPHSLVEQSAHSEEAKLAVQGDGFGVAWYGAHDEPGVYRDIQPAWSNENLLHLCRHIAAGMFIAHVRGATSGATAQANCHPFAEARWSFAHNGQTGRFDQLKRALEARLCDRLYLARRGATDSELLFLLMVQEGLADDPERALTRALDFVREAAAARALPLLMRMTAVFSDGGRLYAYRHASDGKAPTLYASEIFMRGGVALASEPLDGDPSHWRLLDCDRLHLFERSNGAAGASFDA